MRCIRSRAGLCRWLLQSRGLIESNQIALTQEFLSYMLGVRRPTVSVAASELQKDGLISYRRGTITIARPCRAC